MLAASFRIAASMVLALAAAACTYRGGNISDPLTRKLHWFSFVEGEDIRAACAPGTPDRFRVVYNGVYDRQLRMYEMDSLRRLMSVRVTGEGNVAQLSSQDLAAPWRASDDKVQLDQPTYDRLVGQFAASGMFDPPPVGLSLPSHSYYWIAASCRDGQYTLTAWAYPSASFDRITFAETLFAVNPSGIAVQAPGPLPADPLRDTMVRRGETVDFTLKLAAKGLVR